MTSTLRKTIEKMSTNAACAGGDAYVTAWRGRMRLFWLGAPLLTVLALQGCRDSSPPPPSRIDVAQKMFHERCKSAGERIYKTVNDVEGVFLMNIRPTIRDFESQFRMNDPYGHDMGGEGYIGSFLLGSFEIWSGRNSREITYPAYHYVEAVDPEDGLRYRYTGRIDEPALVNPRYLKGALIFELDKGPASVTPPRYGVQFADISTRLDREYWIAGGSLKVIDLETGKVIAERIGYMWDRGQGSLEGGRAPWLFARESACSSLASQNSLRPSLRQTERFVKKVLIPRTTDKIK